MKGRTLRYVMAAGSLALIAGCGHASAEHAAKAAADSGVALRPIADLDAYREKPPCSRTVTDNCTQTYEVGHRRGHRHG